MHLVVSKPIGILFEAKARQYRIGEHLPHLMREIFLALVLK